MFVNVRNIQFDNGGDAEAAYEPGSLVHDGEYWTYEVVSQEGDKVVVTPAYGHHVAWGESPGGQYTKRAAELFPGSGEM